jgi:hypothetical protein
MPATRYSRFRCRRCGWEGVRGKQLQICPACGLEPVYLPEHQRALTVLERNVPAPDPPPDPRFQQIERLRAKIRQLEVALHAEGIDILHPADKAD